MKNKRSEIMQCMYMELINAEVPSAPKGYDSIQAATDTHMFFFATEASSSLLSCLSLSASALCLSASWRCFFNVSLSCLRSLAPLSVAAFKTCCETFETTWLRATLDASPKALNPVPVKDDIADRAGEDALTPPAVGAPGGRSWSS